jgi:hypothetical protein
MAASPAISITGLVTNVAMTSTGAANVWTYPWTVSTTFNGEVTATVSGSSSTGSVYEGTTSQIFIVDNTSPTLLYFTGLKDESRMLAYGMDSGSSTGGNNAWQEFTPTSSGYITRIVMKLRNPTNGGYGANNDGTPSVPFPFEMKIHQGVTSTNGTTLSGGNIIGTTIKYIPVLQGWGATGGNWSNGYTSFTFNTPVAVNAGESYHFQIKPYDTSLNAAFANMYINTSDVYASNASSR